MQVKLTQKGIALLNAMLRPTTATVAIIGPQVGVNSPYSAKDDAGAKQLRTLVKMLERDILEKDPDDAARWSFPAECVLRIQQTYIERIKEMIVHYKPACLSVLWVDAYVELQAALEGKEAVDENPFEDEPKEAQKEAVA